MMRSPPAASVNVVEVEDAPRMYEEVVVPLVSELYFFCAHD